MAILYPTTASPEAQGTIQASSRDVAEGMKELCNAVSELEDVSAKLYYIVVPLPADAHPAQVESMRSPLGTELHDLAMRVKNVVALANRIEW